MPFILQVAAGKRAELTVYGDDYPTLDGTGVRDYIHVMDLADGHAAALTFMGSNSGWTAINLGGGRGYNVREIVREVTRASGRSIPSKVCKRRSGDVAACYANTEKAALLLNWVAKLNLADMCASSWHFQHRVDASLDHDVLRG